MRPTLTLVFDVSTSAPATSIERVVQSTGPVDFGTLGDRDAIKVDGDAGDTVNLSGGGWFNAGAANTQGGPNGYNLYVHDGGGGNEDAYVLVQTVVAVTGAS
jgi:hypothetical protein